MREVSGRVGVAFSSPLIARRTQFIHETNRIRGGGVEIMTPA